MGILSKATKGLTNDKIQDAIKPRANGIDEGVYVAEISDVKLTESKSQANKGTPQLQVEVIPRENWDGEAIENAPSIKAWIMLSEKFASGKDNFTLSAFLASTGMWDADSGELVEDPSDEDEFQDVLMGREVLVYIGYRVTEPNEQYPTPSVFNEVTRWLPPDADLYGGKMSFEDKLAEVRGGYNPDAVVSEPGKVGGTGLKSRSSRLKAPAVK